MLAPIIVFFTGKEIEKPFTLSLSKDGVRPSTLLSTNGCVEDTAYIPKNRTV
jgi:hypothetical protein